VVAAEQTLVAVEQVVSLGVGHWLTQLVLLEQVALLALTQETTHDTVISLQAVVEVVLLQEVVLQT
jgi:hypothetical protein